MIANNIRGVSYLNLEMGVRGMDLIGGRRDLGGMRMDLGGRRMDLVGRRRNLAGAIMSGEVNLVGSWIYLYVFFLSPHL